MNKNPEKKLGQNLFGENIYFGIGYYYLYLTHKLFRTSAYKIKKKQNIHHGERCFIIGNGPSLGKMDLSHLQQEFTFGTNRIYLLFPKLGFQTTYYISVNKLVIQQFGSEILNNVSCPKFISYDARHWIDPSPESIFLYSRNGPHFYKDISKGIWQGATVTYAAMQIAYYMGFEKVILIGVDHNFSAKGEPHEVVTSSQNDLNHFDPNYFGKGTRWQLPDLVTSEIAYKMAHQVYINNNREIIDATVGGKLDIFRKINFDTLF